MIPQGTKFSPHSIAKINGKAQISGRMHIAIGIILGENPSEDVDYENYYYATITRKDLFGGRQKLTSAMKQRAKNLW